MDNFHIDILAEGDETLLEALAIAFRHNAPGGKATHWAGFDMKFKGVEWYSRDRPGTKRPTLVFYWIDPKLDDATPFPAPIKPKEAVAMVGVWMEGLKEGNRFPQEPDHDGSNGEGYRIFCEQWGHVNDNHYAIVAVQPTWAMYGK